MAASQGHEAVSRLLLEKGADVNEAMLLAAAYYGHEAVVGVKRSTAEMTSMIVTPRHNDWIQALWISAHYVCILLLIRYHWFNDFSSATPLKSVISALLIWVAIVLSMYRRCPTIIC